MVDDFDNEDCNLWGVGLLQEHMDLTMIFGNSAYCMTMNSRVLEGEFCGQWYLGRGACNESQTPLCVHLILPTALYTL